jgi:hypothetical protein
MTGTIERRLAALVVCAAAMTACAAAAEACSCQMPPAPAEALGQADAVFLGQVQETAVEPADDAHGERSLVTLSILRSWKGVDEPFVTVYTAHSEAACGYPFELGRRYLVYAAQSAPDALTTSLCTRTRAEAAAQSDLAELGPGRPSLGGH